MAKSEDSAEKAKPMEFIEESLSLLAQTKLDEVTELDSKLDDLREESKGYATQAAQIEADRDEAIRIHAENEARSKELDVVEKKQAKRIGEIDKVNKANLVRTVELDKRDARLKTSEAEYSQRKAQLDVRAEEIIKDAQAVAEVRNQNAENARLLADREGRLEERKANLKKVEVARQA